MTTRSAAEPSTELALRRQVKVFAALGDPTRIALLSRLSRGEPRSLTDLATGRRMTRQAVAKHMGVLEGAGLVTSRKVGRESRFSFAPDRLKEATGSLARISAEWDVSLGRLKTMLESRRSSGGTAP